MNKDLVFGDGALVMLRLPCNTGYTNTWWRVKFVDTDNTFIAQLERYNKHEFIAAGSAPQRMERSEVKDVYNEKDGREWCYSDGVTLCRCEGLCREKM